MFVSYWRLVLYPNSKTFTCLVSIGSKERLEAELLLPTCDEYIQNIYEATKPFNGSKWLMLTITSDKILRDVKDLIGIRMN